MLLAAQGEIPEESDKMFTYLGAATSVAITAGAMASGGVVECIPLGNLLDDAKGTSLINAIASDTYGAGASVNDLGVSRIVKGGLNANALITPTLTFNASSIGGFGTIPNAVPNNDRVFTTSAAPISAIGALQAPMPGTKVDEGIGLWGDMVLSFDLAEIRAAGSMDVDQDFTLTARAGINDYAAASASLRVAVIVSNASGVISGWVNGVEVSVAQSGGAWFFDGAIPSALTGDGERLKNFVVPIPGNATQISFVSVSLGDGNAQDQAIFGDAKLSTIPVPAPGALALLCGGLVMIARRRRA